MNMDRNKYKEECEEMMNEIQSHAESLRKTKIELEQSLMSEKGDKRGLSAVHQFLLNQKTEV